MFKINDCHNVNDFRKLAKKKLPSPIFHYIDGAADDEVTCKRNTESFERCSLIPKVLNNVDKVDIGIKILGKKDPGRTTMDRQEVTVYRGKDGSEYELTEDITTGDVRITKDKPGMAQSGDEVYDTIQDRTTMEYKKGSTDVDPKTGKKIQYPDEYEEVKEVAGPDGTFDDIDEVDDIIAREIDEEIK